LTPKPSSLTRAGAITTALLVAAGTTSAKEKRVGGTLKSLTNAALVQSVLSCMRDFENSSSRHPETIVLANGSQYEAFRTSAHGTPTVTARDRSPMLCTFAEIRDPDSGLDMGFPACNLASGWHVFGSNFGSVRWATPQIPCAAGKPIS